MERPIINSLINYGEQKNIRFHMPGHKGKDNDFDVLKAISNNLYNFDLTEVDGTDNLHNPEGAIKISQDIAAKCYGAEKSFYLVNGSTAGIYAMILSSVEKGDKVIVQRNCHKSVYMASLMGELTLSYITPRVLNGFNFASGVTYEDVKRCIEENKDAKAIVLTSPSYYGTCSDISRISKIARENNMLLLVDGAHGAHFPFNHRLPKGNIALGADIEVVSTHKTLPSLTQTGILNVNSDRVNLDKLKLMLSIYQTSSPSYILMSSIEAGIDIMKTNGSELIDNLIGYIDFIKTRLLDSEFYTVLDSRFIGENGVYDLDPTRLVISSKIGGVKLMNILRRDYNIQVEMADEGNIVIIGTVFDTYWNYRDLYKALVHIEERCKNEKLDRIDAILDYSSKGAVPIALAYSKEKLSVKLEISEGLICGEFISPYPPGIPLLVPGEIITREKVECIKSCKSLGIEISGINDKSLETILTVNNIDK